MLIAGIEREEAELVLNGSVDGKNEATRRAHIMTLTENQRARLMEIANPRAGFGRPPHPGARPLRGDKTVRERTDHELIGLGKSQQAGELRRVLLRDRATGRSGEWWLMDAQAEWLARSLDEIGRRGISLPGGSSFWGRQPDPQRLSSQTCLSPPWEELQRWEG